MGQSITRFAAARQPDRVYGRDKTRQRGRVAVGDSMGRPDFGRAPSRTLLPVESLVLNGFFALPIGQAVTRFSLLAPRARGVETSADPRLLREDNRLSGDPGRKWPTEVALAFRTLYDFWQ